MRHIILICWIFFLCEAVEAQSIDSLKYELSYYKSGEKEGSKIALARILHEKRPFDSQGVHYIARYYYDQNIDSVGIFLDKLIQDYPDKTEPYILKAEYIYLIRNINHDQEKAKCLEQGYAVDSLNIEINYMLADLYYSDFLKPYYKHSWGMGIEEDEENAFFMNTPVRKQVFDKPEDKALFYLYHLKKINPDYKKIVYFPIQQLEKFKDKNRETEDISSIDDNCYFPAGYFLNLSDNWEDDLSRDYLFDMKMYSSQGISNFLQKIEEPCLYKNDDIKNTQSVFRFTWLRTFHNPVCLRLENNGDTHMLHWKLLDGAGGYEHGKVSVSKSKRISSKKYEEFIRLFQKTNLNDLPNTVYYPSTDGASWTLEYKTSNSFKAHDTNTPSDAIIECCSYLLKLTNLKIKEEDIY